MPPPASRRNRAGATLTEITKDFGCARDTARRHVVLAGIPLRDDRATWRTARPKPSATPRPGIDTARIAALYTASSTVKEIANQHGTLITVSDAHARAGAAGPGALFTLRFPLAATTGSIA